MRRLIIEESERDRILRLHKSYQNTIIERADNLRNVIDDLGYQEKKLDNQGELTSAGEITDELSEIAQKLFKDIKEKVPGATITITAGNDEYHARYGGQHPRGQAIDFVVDDYSKYGKDIVEILKHYKQTYSGFRYLDEYVNTSNRKTADHFHFSYSGSNGEMMDTRIEPNRISKRDINIQTIIENGDNRELIGIGSKGEGVKEIQTILKNLKYDLGGHGQNKDGVDGIYYVETKNAVKEFQKDNELKVDGIVGIETSRKLRELSNR